MKMVSMAALALAFLVVGLAVSTAKAAGGDTWRGRDDDRTVTWTVSRSTDGMWKVWEGGKPSMYQTVREQGDMLELKMVGDATQKVKITNGTMYMTDSSGRMVPMAKGRWVD